MAFHQHCHHLVKVGLIAFLTWVNCSDGAYTWLQERPSVYQQQSSGNWGINEDYLVFLPPEYQPGGEPVPVLFFLHGAGRRGSDLTKVASLAPPAQAENGRQFPFMIVAPQCKSGSSWTSPAVLSELMTFIREVVATFNIDENRIYLCGQSMGGAGTWRLLENNPDYFAAAMPICGSTNTAKAADLVHIPIWIFHGALDKTVSPSHSIDMAHAITEAGGKQVKLTVYPDVGHNSWYRAFNEPDIYDWMLRQVKGAGEQSPWANYGTPSSSGFLDTGEFLGWIQTHDDSWVWSSRYASWMHMPHPQLYTDGAWAYFPGK